MNGLFGVVSENCPNDLFYGLDYHSHLGTESAGLAFLEDELYEPIVHIISGSQFKSVFKEDFKKLKGNLGIGVISSVENDKQPILFDSKLGPFALSTSGMVKNAKELYSELIEEGKVFSKSNGINQTELIGNLIAKGDNFVDGIKKALEKIDGSISLLLLSEKERCIYGCGGIFPLTIGNRDKSWAIASETCAFPNLGYKIHEHLEYYEIVSIDESGVKKRGKASGKKIFCSFLPVYYGFPSSSYYGINSEVVRERCGGFLAETDDINPDYVAGIQDSGTPHAIGYCKRKIEIFAEKFEKIKQLMESEVDSNELKSLINNLEKPPSFGLPLVKYNASWSRSYIPPTKALRELIANFKQVSIAEKIKDSRIVVVDDSIRKGNQMHKLLSDKLWLYEPKEIHVRIGSPPQMFPCPYEASRDGIESLAARKAIRKIEGRDIEDVSKYLDPNSEEYKKMVEEIREMIGATSLKYITLDKMIEAIIGVPGNKSLKKEDLCTYCWTGK